MLSFYHALCPVIVVCYPPKTLSRREVNGYFFKQKMIDQTGSDVFIGTKIIRLFVFITLV